MESYLCPFEDCRLEFPTCPISEHHRSKEQLIQDLFGLQDDLRHGQVDRHYIRYLGQRNKLEEIKFLYYLGYDVSPSLSGACHSASDGSPESHINVVIDWLLSIGTPIPEGVLNPLVCSGYVDAFDKLVAAGAVPNLVDFHCACECGKNAIIRRFLQLGFDITSQDEKGYNGIHCAAYNGYDETVSELFDLGVQPIPLPNGETILHIACFVGNEEMIRKFLPIVPITRTNEGKLPFEYDSYRNPNIRALFP